MNQTLEAFEDIFTLLFISSKTLRGNWGKIKAFHLLIVNIYIELLHKTRIFSGACNN